MYRDDDGDAAKPTRPLNREPLLIAEHLEVIRRMRLLQNAAYYTAHIAVANDADEYNIEAATREDYGCDDQGVRDTPSRPSSEEFPPSAFANDIAEVDGGLSAGGGVVVPEKRYAAESSASFLPPSGLPLRMHSSKKSD